MPVLHFSSDHAMLQEESLKKDDIHRLHTNATQIKVITGCTVYVTFA